MTHRPVAAQVLKLALVAAASLVANSTFAAVEVLNFQGLDLANDEGPANYYNGGAGSLGSTGGPNYGISFGPDAIACAGQPGGTCNTAAVPGGGLITFLGGPGDIMNRTAGFTDGFSFYYTSPSDTGSVTVWSGLDGTGTLLATLTLPQTPNGSASNPECLGESYCPWVAAGVTFSGTAESVDFSGAANQIGFANITVGSATAASPAPEPESVALMLAGLGVVGVMARRRRASLQA